MTRWGVWSDAAGGFVSTGFWQKEEAEQEINDMFIAITDSEEAEALANDLEAVQECEYHEEERAEDCDECNAEDEEV